jgi:hypothetical protein
MCAFRIPASVEGEHSAKKGRWRVDLAQGQRRAVFSPAMARVTTCGLQSDANQPDF